MPGSPLFHLRITSARQETKDAKTFTLSPIDGKLYYKPGQFLTIIFQTPFGEKRRSYSISSSPHVDDELMITVKRMDNGEFSRQLIENVNVNETLISTGVSGFFHLPDNLNEFEHYCFFAAGSGITPCYSMIKSLLKTSDKRISLIYSNPSGDETIFHKQLQKLSEEFTGRFTINYLFSREQNRINREYIVQLLNAEFNSVKSKTQFYICGPFQYMRMIQISLLSEGINESNIRKENFNEQQALPLLVPPDISAHDVTIRINSIEYKLTVQFPKSILAVAKEADIAIPYSCETGRCGSCVATCIEGKIWMAYNEVLTNKELQAGLILTCQGFPLVKSVIKVGE